MANEDVQKTLAELFTIFHGELSQVVKKPNASRTSAIGNATRRFDVVVWSDETYRILD